MANTPYKTGTDRRVSITSLLSPPETKPSDSFDDRRYSNTEHMKALKAVPAVVATADSVKASKYAVATSYASPPISPESRQSADFAAEQGARDPQLFATNGPTVPIALDQPLFPRESQESIKVANQVAATEPKKPAGPKIWQSHQVAANIHRIQPSDGFVLDFGMNRVMNTPVREERKEFLKKVREDCEVLRRMIKESQKSSTLPSRKAPAPISRSRQPKVSLPRLEAQAPRTSGRKRTLARTIYDSAAEASPLPPKAESKKRSFSTVADSFDTSAEVKPRKRKTPAPTIPEDDWILYKDFSPDIKTLSPGANHFREFFWTRSGKPYDLSEDPNRHHLHESEIALAETLRWTCARFLLKKRLLFAKCLDHHKTSKKFGKTNAQEACFCDVNKASTMWNAFNKAGWLDRKHFTQFLD